MHVCLITPPSPFLLDERVFPALGILRVGAVLEAAGHKVDHLDLCGVTNSEKVVADYEGASVFGITATTPQIPAAVRIGAALRGRGKTILGGPHPTLLHAAAKRGNERAQIALKYLLDAFDVVVTGDGEKAIFTALHSHGLVDADDPKGILWNTSKDFDQSPWPARHLIDMSSYHYSIDGAKATSMIAQLGCLAPDTPILLESGIELPISDVQKGDRVLCYDTEVGSLVSEVVAETWKREADDIWEVEWSNGYKLRITGEHPVFTGQGWKTVSEVEVGWLSASLYSLPEGFPSPIVNPEGKVLYPDVQGRMAEGECKRGVAEVRTGSDEGQVCRDDRGGEESVLRSRSRKYAIDTVIELVKQAWRPEPNEAARGCCQGVGDNQKTVGNVLLGADEEHAQNWKDPIRESASLNSTQRPGSDIAVDSVYRTSYVYLDRKRNILDWPMPFGEASQPGLSGQEVTQGDSSPRRVLAQPRIGRSREWGLPRQGVGTSSGVVQGDENEEPHRAARQTEIVWPVIVSKQFIGKGTVHNITVHPTHNYFAAGLLVHNCPFHCKFCGGRNSPMLRQIRTRPADSVVDEMLHLHTEYGMTGIMHFQDEMNVSHKGLVDLMMKIKDTGIDWQQRGFVKAELFNDEQAETMYAAGFKWLLCGFEAAHPRILKNIAKNATREDNTRMLRTAHKHGIKVKALMSIGHPGESEETILATRDWLLEEKPDDFDCTIITIYPGTPYFDESVCIGDSVYRFETNGDALYSENTDFHKDMQFYKGAPGEYKSYVWTDYISRERICELRDDVEAEVRSKLGIPYPSSAAAINFEHSMAQNIPATILRSTQ